MLQHGKSSGFVPGPQQLGGDEALTVIPLERSSPGEDSGSSGSSRLHSPPTAARLTFRNSQVRAAQNVI